jgi:pentatricopeptide repeat protein
MTLKEWHAAGHAFNMLMEACLKHKRFATAGELAKEMGVSRNTAQKRLEVMLAEKAVEREKIKRGRVTIIRYGLLAWVKGVSDE